MRKFDEETKAEYWISDVKTINGFEWAVVVFDPGPIVKIQYKGYGKTFEDAENFADKALVDLKVFKVG